MLMQFLKQKENEHRRNKSIICGSCYGCNHSEEVVNTFEIPWTREARKNMREIGSAAKSALSKIQVKSGVSIGLGEFKDGDEKEFLTKQSQKMSETKTLGEVRVRTDFNVSNNSTIDLIKQKSAELINICETLKEKDGRLASIAQTSFEEAAMWAVKAATAQIIKICATSDKTISSAYL